MGNISLSPDMCPQTLTLTKPALTCSSMHEQLIQPHIHLSIVSNSHLLREALTVLLQTHQSIHSIDNYPGDADIISSVTNSANYLFLLDSGIGSAATISHIQAWRSQQPSAYVIVLELKNDSDLILECIEAGAHGYALQGASSAEVIEIVEQVCQGTAQCSPQVTAKLFERLAKAKTVQQSHSQPHLTRRELEVLNCITKNYSDREIATELFIEVRTVKHHVHNILRKLNVKHRWDAAQLQLSIQDRSKKSIL
jgi:DNA-binding NarL/FixJ family response regulator